MNNIAIKDRALLELDKVNTQVNELVDTVNTKAKEFVQDGMEMGTQVRERVAPVVRQMTNTKMKRVGLLTAGLAVAAGVTAFILRKK